jgi:hypothetical protein
MVARINSFAGVGDVLRYNEKKVAQNKAEVIHVHGFLQDKNRITIEQKMQRFQRLHELNDRAKIKALHISLNFDPSEKLSNEKMTAIADRYMEGIGLDKQPYIVFRHNDVGHEHMHIVTSLIREDGKRIPTHNMGMNLSEPTRKAIEKEFDLIPAQGKKQLALQQSASSEISKSRQESDDDHIQKAIYGKANGTRDAVHQVLEMVNRDYTFTSLSEYNAILRPYNIYADTGGENSRTRKYGGLVYRVLDEQGNKIGPPLKASKFPHKPTLANLEKKFAQGQEQREKDIPPMRQRIDWVLQQGYQSLQDLSAELQNERIELIVGQSKTGPGYELTFVDHQLKVAADGSDLGKAYGAESIFKDHAFQIKIPQVLSQLMQSDPTFGHSPAEFEEDQEIRPRLKRGT